MEFPQICERFFDAICEAQPEEATTLGLSAFDRADPMDHRLRDGGPQGPEPELAACRAALEALGARPPENDQEARRDRASIERLARFRLHTLGERREHLENLELSLLPVASIEHLLRRPPGAAREAALAARLLAIPSYLHAREQALLEGAQRGHVVAPDVRQMISGWALPECAKNLEEFGDLGSLSVPQQAAASALRAHGAWVAEHVVVQERGSRLGPDETARRIEMAWGIETSPAALMDDARASLEEARASFLSRAQVHDRSVRTLADADALLMAQYAEQTPAEAIRERYERAMDEARDFCVERGLFEIPEAFEIEVATLAPSRVNSGATNWPTPLLSGSHRPVLALSSSPASHPPIAVQNLAIHEGVPGHGLESFCFRERFGSLRAPVRFLGVHDDLMMASGWVGPMLRIEGFAVYVEELLDRHGFYEARRDTRGAMFQAACQAIRAGRLLADLELHHELHPLDEVAARFAARVGMSARWARMQAVRYLRVPLQASTYYLGGRAVRALVDDLAREGSLAAAHQALFAGGPTPPALL